VPNSVGQVFGSLLQVSCWCIESLHLHSKKLSMQCCSALLSRVHMAPGGRGGLARVSTSRHTFCKGPQIRKINSNTVTVTDCLFQQHITKENGQPVPTLRAFTQHSTTHSTHRRHSRLRILLFTAVRSPCSAALLKPLDLLRFPSIPQSAQP
jgi:hypothetical protein